MNISQRIIPKALINTRPGIQLNPTYITIHETDNPGRGANAEAHARLQERGNNRQASWHIQVDDHQAIQSIPFNEIAWAAGDGRNGPGNRKSIHIEMCVNSDGDYLKTVQNTIEVVRYLMPKFGIPVSNVVQHNHWSGKNCPRFMRSGEKGVTWEQFISKLQTEQAPAPQPEKPVQPKPEPKPKPEPVKESVPYPGHPIKRGSKGKDVERVQRAVKVSVDGIFGPATEKAVKGYQTRHDLTADGVVGPKTWSVMF